MAWITPKTDWYGEVVDGVYVGDRFNASDYNRIKNNLSYLRELAVQMYKEFSIHSIGADKTAKDFFYADEINSFSDFTEIQIPDITFFHIDYARVYSQLIIQLSVAHVDGVDL